MSRSRKKVPVVSIATHKAKTHIYYKKNMTRKTRKLLEEEEEAPDGSYYKKYMHSWLWRPDDGKNWFEDPRSYRK